MKRLLLPLLAALALPTAAKAYDPQEDYVRKNVLPKIQQNMKNIEQFIKLEDYEMVCRTYRETNRKITLNFAGLQKVKPDIDWFKMRSWMKTEEEECDKAGI
tara:strand:+ start:239 stop:544 length:306 start_codon:yes stop_codon:yes gene_type:complete